MPMQTSKEERAQLAELCAKATPGPWECLEGKTHDDDVEIFTADKNWHVALAVASCGNAAGEEETESNAAFIAAARTALPRLLADFADLQKEAEADLADMRRFQALYIKVDHERLELQRKVREFLKAWDTQDVMPQKHIAALRAAVEQE